jgi:hypothetical protein
MDSRGEQRASEEQAKKKQRETVSISEASYLREVLTKTAHHHLNHMRAQPTRRGRTTHAQAKPNPNTPDNNNNNYYYYYYYYYYYSIALAFSVRPIETRADQNLNRLSCSHLQQNHSPQQDHLLRHPYPRT